MHSPGRTCVVNSALVLYGQTDFGPNSAKIGNGGEKGTTTWDETSDSLLSSSVAPNVFEQIRLAVRRARSKR